MFALSVELWQQQAYIKASNTDVGDFLGAEVSLSADGSHLAVAAILEKSLATGINADQSDNSLFDIGAVYVFSGAQEQEAYIKPGNPAVGGGGDASGSSGINGDQTDMTVFNAGAVHLY